MAAAEARAVWQRTANRCFVQEDAKRAPKLACCQPSCATSTLVDTGPTNAADESDPAAVNVTPFNGKSSFSNLSPDSRWWLQMQPSYGYVYQRSLTYEQLNSSEYEVEMLKAGDDNETYKEDVTYFSDEDHDSSYHTDYDCKIDMMKKAPKDRMQAAGSKNSQAFSELMDLTGKYETMGIDHVGCSVSKQMNELGLDSDYSWIEGKKSEPWWRTTDRDELASLVLQKSLDHIENCDLPPPQRKFVRRHPYGSVGDVRKRTACFDREADSSGFSDLTAHAQGNLDSGLMHGKQVPSANEGPLCCASKKASSSYSTMREDTSKAQLMEALCHSQTRARKAEEAAKRAYAEKEHIVKLIFKQASQLFAYKQWFRLLQLETLHFQIKNKDQPISTLFSVALPMMNCEGKKPRKRKQKFPKTKRERQDRPRNDDISAYAVAFALGMSLVGAGLLLGWTVGWMLPHL